jgi:hypothetical protein
VVAAVTGAPAARSTRATVPVSGETTSAMAHCLAARR